MSNPRNLFTMQNVVSRVSRAVTAAIAGGSGATAADCRARATPPSSTPSFLANDLDSTASASTTTAAAAGDDFEIIDPAAASSSSSSSTTPAASPPLSDEVSAGEVSEAIDIVLQNLPAAAQAATASGVALENAAASPPPSVVLSGSASPVSSNGGAASHMRDAEEALAVAAQQQQLRIQTQQFRATLTHLLSDRGVRDACLSALTRSPEFAQMLLQSDEEAGGGEGGGGENNSALADLYPIAARAAFAAAATATAAQRGGANDDSNTDNGNTDDGNADNGNNPLAAAVAEALSALSSPKEFLAGARAATKVLMLEAGVHIVGWTRHLGRLACGEETGPWMSVEGGGRGGGRARARSPRSFGSFRPANLDEWVKLVSAVAMAVVAVIFVRRRGVVLRGVGAG